MFILVHVVEQKQLQYYMVTIETVLKSIIIYFPIMQ